MGWYRIIGELWWKGKKTEIFNSGIHWWGLRATVLHSSQIFQMQRVTLALFLTMGEFSKGGTGSVLDSACRDLLKYHVMVSWDEKWKYFFWKRKEPFKEINKISHHQHNPRLLPMTAPPPTTGWKDLSGALDHLKASIALMSRWRLRILLNQEP